MKLFCRPAPPDPDAIRRLARTPLGSGGKRAGQVLGFIGTFGFSLPPVYLSRRLAKLLEIAPDFSAQLDALVQRICRGDYGSISDADKAENVEIRYLSGHWLGMTARYETAVGVICFRAYRCAALFSFEGERVGRLPAFFHREKR